MRGAGERLFVQGQHFQKLGADQIDVVLEHGLQMRLWRRGQGCGVPFSNDGNSIAKRLQVRAGATAGGRNSGGGRVEFGGQPREGGIFRWG